MAESQMTEEAMDRIGTLGSGGITDDQSRNWSGMLSSGSGARSAVVLGCVAFWVIVAMLFFV